MILKIYIRVATLILMLTPTPPGIMPIVLPDTGYLAKTKVLNVKNIFKTQHIFSGLTGKIRYPADETGYPANLITGQKINGLIFNISVTLAHIFSQILQDRSKILHYQWG